MNGYRPLSAVGALLLTIGLTACAGANSAPPMEAEHSEEAPAVEVEELAAGEQDAGLELDFDGPVGVEFRRITIPPGLGTGKHCHHGNLIAVVEQGTLTHYAPIYPDGVHEYQTGDSVFEGAGYVHEGKNEGDEDMILMVTYLTPEGEPLAETDLARCE
ncbi:MAG: cupin domain-containing protein [Leucobacter sp.]